MHPYIHTCKFPFLQNIQIPTMAVSVDRSSISSNHFAHNDDFLREYKCLKRDELERQLEETLTKSSTCNW